MMRQDHPEVFWFTRLGKLIGVPDARFTLNRSDCEQRALVPALDGVRQGSRAMRVDIVTHTGVVTDGATEEPIRMRLWMAGPDSSPVFIRAEVTFRSEIIIEDFHPLTELHQIADSTTMQQRLHV